MAFVSGLCVCVGRALPFLVAGLRFVVLFCFFVGLVAGVALVSFRQKLCVLILPGTPIGMPGKKMGARLICTVVLVV